MSHIKQILIIDDDAWFGEMMVRTLVADGYVVEHAADAVQGMDALDERTPDMIVLDLHLPGYNGLTLLHELKSHSDLSKIPVVVCTNSADSLKPGVLEPYGVRRVIDKATMQPGDIVAAVKMLEVSDGE